MKHLKINLIISMLFCVLFYFSAFADEADYNLKISLDLSNYDTFDETVEVLCKGEGETGFEATYELNLQNDYSYSIVLEPGKYNFALSVKNDALGLIDLSPMNFEIEVDADVVQDIVIAVSDKAGMSGISDEHSGFFDDAEGEDDNIVSLPQRYEWGNTSQECGILHVKGPDVAGLKSITYSLQDQNGEVFCYVLNESNQFQADIELPFGRYNELLDNVSITSEEGINIPENAMFYCKYQGNLSGQSIKLTDIEPEKTMPKTMQLWVRYTDGANVQMKNLYQYAGDSVLHKNKDEENQIIGHDDIEEDDLDIENKVDNLDSDFNDVEELAEPEESQSLLPMLGFIIALISIILIVFVGMRRRRER